MRSRIGSLSIWFGLIMILVVLSGAFAFAFTDFMYDRLFGARRTLFIFILIAYGIYRIFRLFQSLKQDRGEE